MNETMARNDPAAINSTEFFERARARLRFEKGVGAKYLELKIDDRQKKLQPEFEIKDWE